jgi:hypothetical protein
MYWDNPRCFGFFAAESVSKKSLLPPVIKRTKVDFFRHDSDPEGLLPLPPGEGMKNLPREL